MEIILDDRQDKIKVSEDAIKIINPSYKKVYRFFDKETGYALGDVIALADEKIQKDKYTLICPTEEWKTTTIENYEVKELQVPIFENGKQVYEVPTVKERQKYCKEQFETIYPEIKRSANPHGYYVDLTKKLLELKKQLILESRNQKESAKQYIKVM